MIVVVDYKKGNLMSVERGLRAVGGDARISDDPAAIARASAIVLPGVGAFADAAETMEELGQMTAIRERVRAGVPFLGICLGLHLMFEEGVEGTPGESDGTFSSNAHGLGLLPGVVRRMPREDASGVAHKVPHVGWNTVEVASSGCALLDGLPQNTYFYFTHSYIVPEGRSTVARTTHSVTFPSAAVFGDRAFGVQFHPEKSSDEGLRVLRNFVDIVKGA